MSDCIFQILKWSINRYNVNKIKANAGAIYVLQICQ